ncbi:MAG: PRC-barrel domain-containing protein [Chloroflexota bacterium]
MRRRDLIGRPVLELNSGRYIGEAREIIVDLSSASVVGIVVQRGRWFRSTWILPFENVLSCGDGVITVADDDALIAHGEFDQGRSSGRQQLVGKRILSEQGRDLGTLDDIFFDPASCAVTGYQISAGVVQDLLEGKRSMPAVPLLLGYDAVIVSGEIPDGGTE